MGFRREAYQNASEAEFRAHGAKNIRSTFQFQNHALPRFLDFAVRNGNGAIIRYGGAEDGGVGVGSLVFDSIIHFPCTFNRQEVHAVRDVQGSGAGDEKDAVAFVNSRFRQAIPHFSGGVVGEVSDGVNSFSGGACRDKKTHERHYAESRVKVKSDLVQLRIMFRLDSFPRLGEL